MISSSVFSFRYFKETLMLSFSAYRFEVYSEEAFDILMGLSVASVITNEWNGSSPAYKTDGVKGV